MLSGSVDGSGNYTHIYGSCVDGLPASCIFNGSVVAHGDTVTAYENASVAFGSSCVFELRTCNNGTLDGSYMYSNCTVDTVNPSDCTLPW